MVLKEVAASNDAASAGPIRFAVIARRVAIIMQVTTSKIGYYRQ
jgi:hypothetical protein